MRISMLEQRENFYHILCETLTNWSPPKVQINISSTEFLANKYLNFIASPQLPDAAFANLIREYSATNKIWRKLIQQVYVKLAVNKHSRKVFSHKTLVLPKHLSDFLILGGNHRLRLFNQNHSSSYVVLKTGESPPFIENEILIKKKHNLSYAPRLLSNSVNWLEEEYIKGIPLNRLRLNSASKQQKITSDLLSVHKDKLIMPSKTTVPATKYLREKKDRIIHKLEDENLLIRSDTKKTILETFDRLSKKIKIKNVQLSWSHGDFQQGNVLVTNDSFKVIDWEAADKRFWLYDFFVLLGEIRSHGDLSTAFSAFSRIKSLYLKDEFIPENHEALLMMEELNFSINEDCSPNYYQSGEKTLQLCKQINSHLQA